MYEIKKYDNEIEYRIWIGQAISYGRLSYFDGTSLIVTPDNVNGLVDRVAEIHDAIDFSSLIVKCPRNTQFDSVQKFDVFAPYVKLLIVEDDCNRIDFEVFKSLAGLVAFSTMIPKPKKLHLSVYPELRYAGLGQLDKVETIEGVQRLEELRLYKKLHTAKTGWQWLETLPKLQKLWVIQSELTDLCSFPECETMLDFSLAYPRGLFSIDGIESFKNLTQLEIEGAKQLHNYMPIASLKKLDYLGILGSGKPGSLDFLYSLPLLKRAVIGDYEYIKVDGKFVKERM